MTTNDPQSTDPKPAALDLVIYCFKDGWPVDVQISLPVEKVGLALERLAGHGFAPRHPSQGMGKAALASQNGSCEAAPINGAGTHQLTCPIHVGRKLKGPNRWGKYYCTHKDRDEQYCDYEYRP